MTRKIIDMQREPEGTLLVFKNLIVEVNDEGGIKRIGGLRNEAAETIQNNVIRRRILTPIPVEPKPEPEPEPEKTFAEELKELHLSIMSKEGGSPLAGIMTPEGDVITEEQYLKEKRFMDRWWHGIGS